jgi:hypothetical protein
MRAALAAEVPNLRLPLQLRVVGQFERLLKSDVQDAGIWMPMCAQRRSKTPFGINSSGILEGFLKKSTTGIVVF